MSQLLGQRPSPAMIVALIALFVALGGSSFAAVKLNGKNIKNGTVSGQKLKKNTLAGKQVKESKLGKVPTAKRADSARRAGTAGSAESAARATSATSANTATSATNAGLLDGLDSTAFPRRDCDSVSGAVKGFARIDATASFSSTFTTAGVQSPYNCSGQSVEARRAGTGAYEVRFNGNSAAWALANSLSIGTFFDGGLGANVVYDDAARLHRVLNFQTTNGALGDRPFVILLF